LWRHYAAAVLLPALIVILAATLLGHWLALGALLLGAAAGAALGQWNMKLSRLENTQDGFFYTPNMRLGLMISMLMVSRIIYRFFELYLQMHNGTPAPQEFAKSPLTVLLFGLLAGFYGAYNLLLVRWRRSQKPVTQINIFNID
jgi:cytochrome b561